MVGSAVSYTGDHFSFITTAAENKDIAEIANIPRHMRTLQTPGQVKSAVGSSRNKAKIQIRTLIDKSQATTLSGTYQIPSGPIGTYNRNLKT